MMRRSAWFMAALLSMVLCSEGVASDHPRLFLQSGDINEPLPSGFEQAVEEATKFVAPHLASLPDVPVPADPGGGYTHEQHKRNAKIIRRAGLLYSLTGDQAYADLVRDLLFAYGDLYPTLGQHPVTKSSTPGRLFWQSLNESVWLVEAIEGYDAVFNVLEPEARQRIEQNILRPLARFLSEESPEVFHKIHNHGTWAVTAVGLTGYVLGDDLLVEQALKGLDRSGKAGFLKQLDELFSPDGYYTEGPYYQRYALMPFLLFAKAIERNEPDRQIFEHRDGVLLKAINALVHMNYGGLFFPINDAIKDKGIDTIELCFGIALAWALTGDESLLSVARAQDRIVLSSDGLNLARALDELPGQPWPYRSMVLSDGPAGDRGALGIFRAGEGEDHLAVVFKATSQGLNHGHFDRLAWLLYDDGRDVVTDYGAARFLNVEAKEGGRYLPENKSYAKQTVAHNTLVVDNQSQFGADYRVGEDNDTQVQMFHHQAPLHVASARVDNAWEGVGLSRSLALVEDPAWANPVLVDILTATSKDPHRYDLPLHFKGQVTRVSHAVTPLTDRLEPLGDDNGYQHLWVRASAEVDEGDLFQLTWIEGNRFYTWSVLAPAPMTVFFTQTGANDPNFNLLVESGVVLRLEGLDNATLVGVLEPHGKYDGTREFTSGGASGLNGLAYRTDGTVHAVELSTTRGERLLLGMSTNDDNTATHVVPASEPALTWSGPAHLWRRGVNETSWKDNNP